MKKSTRIVKKLLALFLVVLMSINTFAAIVGDNDGAAFITKAEFDSMKTNFQDQLDRYNSSIDNKIDGAIASYLSGVTVAKQTEIKAQLSNYNEIYWVKDLQVYGSKRNFTGKSTYTTITDKWFDMPADKRMCLRSNGEVYWAALASSWWWETICVQSTINVASGKPILTGGAYWNPNTATSIIPLSFLQLDVDLTNAETFVSTTEPWAELDGLSNFLCTYRAATTNYNDDVYYRRTIANGRCEEETGAAEGKLFGYKMYYKTSETGAEYDYIGVIHTTKNTPWPCMNGSTTHPSLFGCKFTQGQISSQTDSATISAIVNAGCNLISLNASTKAKQVKLMQYLMFGKDCTKEVNVYEPSYEMQKIGYDVPVTTDSDFLSTTITLTQGYISDYHGSDGTNKVLNRNFSPQPTISFSLPLLPRRKLKNQNSNKFRYNNKYLKYGQGLPLTTSLNENCKIKLSFEYKIYNILTDAEWTTNRSIAISVKDNDYLSDGNYLSGQINESAAEVALNERTITTTDGKVTIMVNDVKKDQNLWFRLYPTVDTDDNKYYAKISNLKVTSITE